MFAVYASNDKKMKVLRFIPLLSIFVLSGCSTVKTAYTVKNSAYLVQLSDFTATTPGRDTLYIKTDCEIGCLLHTIWLSGAYNDTEPKTTVIEMSDKEFSQLLNKSIVARN